MRFSIVGEFERVPETAEIDLPVPHTRIHLEIQDETGLRRIPVGDRPLVIGNGTEADVQVADPTLSRRHCCLDVTREGLRIIDLGSRNGTYVGGARIREVWGGVGTNIVAGRTAIMCVLALGAPDLDTAPVPPLRGVAGASSLMRQVAVQVRQLAHKRWPVLVTGETGTGKELVAHALHDEGPRATQPFLPINVTTLPRELVESELFGHERGAFTGATVRREGAFADAEGGTLFLDEIGELSTEAQPKLLRALDGYEIRRVGEIGPGRRADVRIVAATHVPLLARVQAGHFRRDLYHRLEAHVVEIPPLRARPGDIVPIANVILSELAVPHDLAPSAVAALIGHDWPGNVRDLRNVLIRAAELTKDARSIEAPAILRGIRGGPEPRAKILMFSPDRARDWLDRHSGNVSAAARAAQMPRTTFRKLLAKGE